MEKDSSSIWDKEVSTSDRKTKFDNPLWNVFATLLSKFLDRSMANREGKSENDWYAMNAILFSFKLKYQFESCYCLTFCQTSTM